MHRRSNVALLLAMLPLVACSTPDFGARAVGAVNAGLRGETDLMADGYVHFHSGNFALAIQSFRQALRLSPNSAPARNALAAAYDRLGRFDLARRYYEEALAVAPDDPAVRSNYAASLRLQGLDHEAASVEPAGAGHAEAEAPPLPAFAAPAAPPAATIVLAPPPEAPDRLPRLERISTGEVALVTRPETGRQYAAASFTPPAPAPAPAPPAAAAPPAATAPAATAAAPMRILNAVGRRGQAGRMAGHLRGQGWDRTSVGDARSRRQQSLILADRGTAGAAEALARSLPFRPRVVTSAAPRPLVLVLGRDALAFDDRLRQGPGAS